MILLDTDHVTALRYTQHPRAQLLMARLQETGERLATTVVTLEEQLRGWLAELGRWRSMHRQVPAYDALAKLFAFFREWEIVPFDVRAADEFERLRKSRVRIGQPDLKIASIALIHKALLLSANLRDFRQVPGLRVEHWLT